MNQPSQTSQAGFCHQSSADQSASSDAQVFDRRTMPHTGAGERGLWMLHGCVTADGIVQEIPISAAVFTVGRRADMHLSLQCGSVSKHHANMIATPDRLFVRDLNSTNGTFINGNRIDCDSPVGEGDVIQFAELEFRVSRGTANDHDATRVSAAPDLGWSLSQFDRLMNDPALTPWFQPVVSLSDGSIQGYEVLARSDVRGLENPRNMFLTATRLAMDVPLSELCRQLGMKFSERLVGHPTIFLNTHPSEKLTSRLVESLTRLREDHPEAEIVIELHEAAVAKPHEMRAFRRTLNDLRMRLAYDDFGAGQSRLHELIETPPDILKFDIGLIRDIHKASDQARRMLSMLVHVVVESNVIALAEGVECAEEASVCRELGFQLAQGWHFGRPAPVDQWIPSDPSPGNA